MAGPATHPHENAIDGLGPIRSGIAGNQFLQAQESGQRQPKGGKAPDSQKLPATESGAIVAKAGDEIEHGALPPSKGGMKYGGKADCSGD
jgi:hypothetical protein